MDALITFIIVTWNNEDTIIECLDSIYKYCKNFKIIIVDNDSKDNTITLIKKHKYNNCKILDTKNNNGFAVGNNIGLEYVDTDYICYLNPDTILLEDIIQPSIRVLNTYEDVGIVGSKLLYKDYSLQASTFNFEVPNQLLIDNLKIGKLFPNFIREKYFPNFSKCKKSKYVDWIIGAEMILRTKDAKDVSGFSTEYYMYTEDMDLCKKVKDLLGKRVYYLADNKLIHIGGVSESKNINYNKMKKMLDNKIIFNKKFYGIRKAKSAARSLRFSYFLRKWLVKLFCFGKNREYLLSKMSMGYKFSKEIVKEV